MPMIAKCFKCGEPGYCSSDCRRQKSVNLIKGQYELEPSNDKGQLCELDGYDEEDFYKDDDERQTYVARKRLLTVKVVAAKQVIS